MTTGQARSRGESTTLRHSIFPHGTARGEGQMTRSTDWGNHVKVEELPEKKTCCHFMDLSPHKERGGEGPGVEIYGVKVGKTLSVSA